MFRIGVNIFISGILFNWPVVFSRKGSCTNMQKLKILDRTPVLTEVTEDIYKLSVRFPFGMREVNSYLFKGENGFTVVDPGVHTSETIEMWEQVLSSGINLEKIIITHAHVDHFGLAGWFQENYHVPVYISDLGFKQMQKKTQSADYIKWKSSMIRHFDGPNIPEELMITEQEVFQFIPDGFFEGQQKVKLGNDLYDVIWTPGHSLDHMCFYNRERKLMVIGDMVLEAISPVITVWTNEDGSYANSLKCYFDSLDVVSSYSTNLILPGHGELITNLPKRSEEIKNRHKLRMNQIVGFLNDEWKTAGQIYKEIYGNLSINKFYSPLIATVTRLIYLESAEKISCEIHDGKYYYKLSDDNI